MKDQKIMSGTRLAWPRTAPLPLLMLFVGCLVSMSVKAATFHVTESECGAVPGGYAWAVDQANANPGRDTISIDTPVVGLYSCGSDPARVDGPDIQESVDILGNGNKVTSPYMFLTQSGQSITYGRCPGNFDFVYDESAGFLLVGESASSPAGIEVTVSDLNMEDLTTIARVEGDSAKLTITNSSVTRATSIKNTCLDPIFDVGPNASLIIRDSVLNLLSMPEEFIRDTEFPITVGIISGSDGDLVLDNVEVLNSSFNSASPGFNPLVVWLGSGTVTVVSSKFVHSGGFWLAGGASMRFVNSVYQSNVGDRIFTTAKFGEGIHLTGGGATLHSEASTFYFVADDCGDCNFGTFGSVSPAKVFGILSYGVENKVRLDSTAIGANQQPVSEPIIRLGAPGGLTEPFSSDAYTWVQPTPAANGAYLSGLLPDALTAEPGLPKDGRLSTIQLRYPIFPGVLVEAIPDALPGGANELLNPIDGTPITLDVLGQARVYANGSRNIGAVQNVDAPLLTASAGDSKVKLTWTPTPVGELLGYIICISETQLDDPLLGDCPETQALVFDTKITISERDNGSVYWFAIRTEGGVWSQVASAKPMGSLGIPNPTAVTIGDSSLRVFWEAPTSTGGFSGFLTYHVVYRPLGEANWIAGPSTTAQTTLLTGLNNGTTYEIGVLASTDDGGASPTPGVIQGTPQAAPTLSYSEPGVWPEGSPLALVPTVGLLQGVGSYSLESGSLPAGMVLDTSTGVISGTPTTQAATNAVVRLTDGATGLYVDVAVPLEIVAPSLDPQLAYPRIQATVGIGPASAVPSQSGIPANATWSVAPGDDLPAGFAINSSTGEISGTATAAPGRVVAISIQACWGNCNPLAGEVRLAPMVFWILPRLAYPHAVTGSPADSLNVTPMVDLWNGGQFDIESGSLPGGVSLDPTTGALTGTPTDEGIFSIKIRYSTGVNVKVPPLEYVYSTIQIEVKSPPKNLTYADIDAVTGSPITPILPVVTGLIGPPTYSVIGVMPQGLSLDPDTGEISGVPTGSPGLYPVSIQVADRYGTGVGSVAIRLQLIPQFVPKSIPMLSGMGLLLLVVLMALIAAPQSRHWKRN